MTRLIGIVSLMFIFSLAGVNLSFGAVSGSDNYKKQTDKKVEKKMSSKKMKGGNGGGSGVPKDTGPPLHALENIYGHIGDTAREHIPIF